MFIFPLPTRGYCLFRDLKVRSFFDICTLCSTPTPPCRPYTLAMSGFLALPHSWVLLLLVLSLSTLSAAGSSFQSMTIKEVGHFSC